MNRRLLLVLGAAGLLAACATTPAPVATAPKGPLEELEPLYAARAGRDVLIIQVASNGCTQKADFAVYVQRDGAARSVRFGRWRLDTCQSFAQGKVELSFTWAELGVGPHETLFLLYPLTAWTGPGV